MNYARTRRGLVVLVTLLLGLSLVAPAAVAVGPHDDGGDGFGDGLSSDSDAESGDSLFSDSDSDSGSGSDSDSSGDTTTSGGDSSSDTSSSDTPSSDSDSSDSFGSDDDTDSSDSSDSFGSDDDTNREILPSEGDDSLLRQSLPSLVSDSTTASLDSETVSETDLVNVDATSSTSGTGYQIELVELTASDDPILRLTATGGTTDGVATTLTTVSDALSDTGDRLTAGTSGPTDATADTARVASPRSRDSVVPAADAPAAVEPQAADADGSGDTGAMRQNAVGVEAPISPEDVPGGPAGAGAMVGLLGAAAAAATRQSGALSGMTGSLETTARTTAAAMPGSSYLDRLVRMLAPFRYSRYDDSDPLEHDAREAMFEVVEDSPGTYLSEIADRADIPLSTARHHIRVLEREDLVSGAKVRGKRRFYPAHTEGVELAAAMNDDSTAAVIDALARLGAASVSDLADELGKDPSTVTHHVQRLEEDEVVVRERDGRAVMNKLTAAARTMLEPEEPPAERPAAGEAMASD
jgi:DNA-binding MarR family transcriptional regulator